MREKKDICDVLKTLEATVNLTGSFMEQYILYPDQLNAWLRHLANLQSSILELMKKLEVIAPGKIVFESVKFVLLCRLGLKGQMEKLKKGRDDLKLLQQEYVYHSRKNSFSFFLSLFLWRYESDHPSGFS